jgi:hypothetical protein
MSHLAVSLKDQSRWKGSSIQIGHSQGLRPSSLFESFQGTWMDNICRCCNRHHAASEATHRQWLASCR